MSLDQAQRVLNQIDKDIADLEKKMADLARKEANKTKHIGDMQRSITKNTRPGEDLRRKFSAGHFFIVRGPNPPGFDTSYEIESGEVGHFVAH